MNLHSSIFYGSKMKKVIIIGGGVSGMAAGIYLHDNGYDVTLYEKHNICGGLCTGYKRKNNNIDACAHFIVGTSQKSELFPLWKHIGAFDENTKIYPTEYYSKYDIDGNIITFYSDLNKLKAELYKYGPDDKRKINSFIRGIKNYQRVKIPTKKPIDFMNIFELTAYGLSMFIMLPRLIKYKHTSVTEYANKFKSPILKELFLRLIDIRSNIHSVFYMLQAFSNGDAGMPEGGSLKMALNIEKRFKESDGNILTSSEVDKIIIEDNKAKGIKLKNGGIDYADYVISATDMHHTLFDLLDNKYQDKYYNEKFENKTANPLNIVLYVVLNYKTNESKIDKMINFATKDLDVLGYKISHITIRNYIFDKKLINDNNYTLTTIIKIDDKTADKIFNLSKEEYKAFKNSFGLRVREEVKNHFDLNDEEIELIDVATPKTFNRYTNSYKGSWMAFLTTKKSKGLLKKGCIRGIDNFFMAGQWLMPPGGLPIALFNGKHAAQRVCKKDKKKFINKEQ